MDKDPEFDWRDYIRIDRDTYFFDDAGKPTPELRRYDPDRIKQLTAQSLARRDNERLVEKTLDQISLIPEVQSLIKGSAKLLHDKAARDPDLAKETNGKLKISVTDQGRTDYTLDGTINLNSKDFLRARYKTPFGYQDFSLQQVLIHELKHGVDKTLGPEKDLAQRKSAMRSAISSVFDFYPDLKSEYDKSQTLMGRPVGELFQAKNLKDFSEKLGNSVLQGWLVSSPIDQLDSFVQSEFAKQHKDEAVSQVLYSVYQNTYNHLVVQQDEMHVIKDTNDIIAKYFAGEPARVSYDGAEKTVPLGRISDPPPSFAPYIHPDINQSARGDLVPTGRCHRAALPNGCPDTHIDGVSYPEKSRPSAPASTIEIKAIGSGGGGMPAIKDTKPKLHPGHF